MNIRSIILALTVMVFFSGCKTSLQSNWRNFNAYYNTYYNAKKSYNSGLKKNLGQARQYNPLQPIRIHPVPINAGAEDFDKAIEKGADVLRRYEDTKWVDDALALIGRSYYYKQEYFSADQKFKELMATTKNPRMQQQSILWQGRILLDLEAYREGVAYLTEQLTLLGDDWERGIKAEVKAILAQHHVKLGNWQLASSELAEALPNLPKKEYRERGYFLLGQIYEELENPETAYEAYDKVQDHYTEYRVQYLAQRKKAEVARNLGRTDVAYRIFNEMVRDDKNLEYKAELDFELARTEHERGNFEQAEKIYKDILHNNLRQPAAEIAARSYYGLAEIYRFYYDDFSMAAAYYDSAAQKKVSADKLPEDFEAGELAESFGSYARIRSEIALQDSLLMLGQLSPEAFDSVLIELKRKKLAELEKLREQQEKQQNQMVAVNRGGNEEDNSTTSLTNGFLNDNNPIVQENARQQFFAVWGDRPLADYWRVRSMISFNSVSETNTTTTGNRQVASGQGEVMSVQIDLSGIPFTRQEQDSVRQLIAEYQYELGNLFFLNLSNPDSAVYYFEKAIENPSKQSVNTVSMYSLSELYAIQGNEEQARYYAQKLVDEYPRTEYAARASENFGIPLTETDEMDEVDPIQIYTNISDQDSVSAAQKANQLRSFAYTYPEHKIANKALYEAIQHYMEVAKEEPVYEQNISEWRQVTSAWKETQQSFQVEKDTARAMLQDTTLSEEEKAQYQAVVDSTIQQPDFKKIFPYRGAGWDTVRAVADTFKVMYPDSRYIKKVNLLMNEFKIPDEEKEEAQPEPEEENENRIEPSEEGYYTCKDIEAELNLRTGMQNFLSSLSLPEDTEIDSVVYEFKVSVRGILEGFTLQTEDVPENLRNSIERGFQRMIFEPVMYKGEAVPAECTVTFPIGH